MLILPAIDLYEGKAVRLLRGDYAQMTVYSGRPVDVARGFEEQGATWLHVVDLEGARSGTAANVETILAIERATGLRCEVGGGVRSLEAIERYLGAGVDRVILGTAAATDEALLTEALGRFGERIAVGVDVRDGQVAVKGWTESAGLDAMAFCSHLRDVGTRTLICTDISRDGAMMGTNVALYRALRGLGPDVIASGGVSSLDDVRALAGLGLRGAIVGKALYAGAFTVADAISATKEDRG